MGESTHNPARFIMGQSLALEETRHVEFKEVRGPNPVKAIVNAADEYAVAFLNSEGGCIYWGVRDDGVVNGVELSAEQKDKLRREVANKLHGIQPQIDPGAFAVEIHPVCGDGVPAGLTVIQLAVPRPSTSDPFYTEGGAVFVRVDGVKRKLSGPQLTAWIKRRGGHAIAGAETVGDPRAQELVTRVRRIFHAHGLEPSHLERFLRIRKAPFSITLSDLQNDGGLLAWLNEDKINWLAQTFLIRREWIDGEDNCVHERFCFHKNTKGFFATVSENVDSLVWEDIPASAEAYFIRWGKGKEWLRNGSYVFVVLAVPIARVSNERIVFKYISDFLPYPWEDFFVNIQLRAWARLLCLNKSMICHGWEIPYKSGSLLDDNEVFLHEFIHSNENLSKVDWHPDDFAFSEHESRSAKGIETFPQVIEFLRFHGLPCEGK